jgi:hypothetical protein
MPTIELQHNPRAQRRVTPIGNRESSRRPIFNLQIANLQIANLQSAIGNLQ